MLRLIFFCTFLFSFLSSLFAEGSMTGIDYNIPVDQLSPLIGKKGDDQIGLVNNLNAVLGIFANILLYIVPILAGISMMIAGYYYIFSSGDSEKASKAKTIIKWNIVAILVAFFSYSLVKMVLYIMNLV